MSFLLWVLVALCHVTGFTQDSWPGFRGPMSLGLGKDNSGLPIRWSESENISFKIPVPGRGWASPIISHDQIFILTAISDGIEETPKKGLYFGGERPEPSGNKHTWKMLSYDWNDGHLIWQTTLHEGAPLTPIHVKNSYASETPTTDGSTIVAFVADIGAFALNQEGETLWKFPTPARKRRLDWGSASSPVLFENRVILQNDNEESSSLTCLDLTSGNVLWSVPRDEPSNWSTPYIWKNKQRTEIVTNGRNRVRSYDLSGNLLWEMPGLSTIAIPTPFAVNDDLIICAGYVGDRQPPSQPILRISPGGIGNIGLEPDQESNSFIRWRVTRASSYNPSPVCYKNILYTLWDFGFFNARDIHTGMEFYEKTRIQRDPPVGFSASPWAYDDKIFCLSEEGETFVFKAGTEFELLHTNKLNEMCLSTPALARSALILRSISHLYKIQTSPDSI